MRTGEISQAAPDPKQLGGNRFIAGILSMRFIEETRDGRGRNPRSDILGSDDDAARSDDSRGIDLQADDLQAGDSKAGALAINASEVEGLSDRASGGDASADRGCRGCDSKVNVVPKAIRA